MNLAPNFNVRLILDRAGTRRVLQIERFPLTIGRGADRDLSLPHPQVSGEHARIERDADGYLLRDTGSRHGLCSTIKYVDFATQKRTPKLSLDFYKQVIVVNSLK